jgi:hypothetical protein
MTKTPEELYQEGEKRFNDAVQRKVPDRIPVALLYMFFGAQFKYGRKLAGYPFSVLHISLFNAIPVTCVW